MKCSIHIGASEKTVAALTDAILSILAMREPGQDRALLECALEVLQKGTTVKDTTVTNCTFKIEADKEE